MSWLHCLSNGVFSEKSSQELYRVGKTRRGREECTLASDSHPSPFCLSFQGLCATQASLSLIISPTSLFSKRGEEEKGEGEGEEGGCNSLPVDEREKEGGKGKGKQRVRTFLSSSVVRQLEEENSISPSPLVFLLFLCMKQHIFATYSSCSSTEPFTTTEGKGRDKQEKGWGKGEEGRWMSLSQSPISSFPPSLCNCKRRETSFFLFLHPSQERDKPFCSLPFAFYYRELSLDTLIGSSNLSRGVTLFSLSPFFPLLLL